MALAVLWIAAVTGAIFAGPIRWLIGEWSDNPYFQHGPLVPIVSFVLAAAAWPHLRIAAAPTGRGGPALVIAGLLLRVLGAAGGSEFLGAVGLIPVLAGLVLWWLGPDGLRRLAFPIGYLFVALPLPFMDDIGFYFQRISTISTTVLVRLLGVPATYQGAEVSLPPANFGAASFFVGVQCSGLYSSMALVALGLIFLRLLDLNTWLPRIALIAAVFPIALLTNDIRLGTLLWIAYRYSSDVAMSYYHNLGGAFFWALALSLFFAVGKGLEWLRPRVASSSPASYS